MKRSRTGERRVPRGNAAGQHGADPARRPSDVIGATANGVLIPVRVVPRAAASGVAGTRGNALLVRLHAPPVDGAANAELIDVMADLFGVPRRAVRIAAGEKGRSKTVHVDGLSADEAGQALATYLDAPQP